GCGGSTKRSGPPRHRQGGARRSGHRRQREQRAVLGRAPWPRRGDRRASRMAPLSKVYGPRSVLCRAAIIPPVLPSRRVTVRVPLTTRILLILVVTVTLPDVGSFEA